MSKKDRKRIKRLEASARESWRLIYELRRDLDAVSESRVGPPGPQGIQGPRGQRGPSGSV